MCFTTGKLKNIRFPKVTRVLVYSEDVDKYLKLLLFRKIYILKSVFQLSENSLRDDIDTYTSRMSSPQY